ncbi:MAG TPA: GNAT family N-acetyltransferase [Phycisphaerales bacterium]|nr:GNAT family N-acetyltransferase [Phycisphaerales bacterium]
MSFQLLDWINDIARIRPEQPHDFDAVSQVNQLAFDRLDEAFLVDRLRETAIPHVSLVAEDDDGQVVGHILFSPANIHSPTGDVTGMGLAPMAVHPDHQFQGIGTQLLKAGINAIAEMDMPYVIVLGHVDYYPRFGFVPASLRNIRCQWTGIPDEAFMILVLDPIAMQHVSGTAYYHPVFEEIM